MLHDVTLSSKRRNLVRYIILALCAILLRCAATKPGPFLNEEERSRNLESFDYVWNTIHEKHFDPDFGGVDWDMVRDTLYTKMAHAKTWRDSRAIIQQMIDVLNLSHFNIIPAEVYERMEQPAEIGSWGGMTGMDIRILDSRVYVISVEKESPAAKAGVHRGWEVIRLGDFVVQTSLPSIAKAYDDHTWKEYIITSAVFTRMSGSIGDTLDLELRDVEGNQALRKIVLEEQKGRKVQLGHFPPFYVWLEHAFLEDSIGYIAFNAFLDPVHVMPAFNQAIESFMESPGIIIDIRGNPGGMLEMGMGMAGWFIGEKAQYLGTMFLRDMELKMVIRPRPQTYSGPLAILVDGLSGSCSEVFSGGLKDLERAKLFGMRTIGAALPSLIEKLPNGDGFQYAFANYRSFNGRILEGAGVVPDVEVEWTPEALSKGYDPVLQAAMDWIRSEQASDKNH